MALLIPHDGVKVFRNVVLTMKDMWMTLSLFLKHIAETRSHYGVLSRRSSKAQILDSENKENLVQTSGADPAKRHVREKLVSFHCLASYVAKCHTGIMTIYVPHGWPTMPVM